MRDNNVDSAKFNCISLFSGAGGLDMGVELGLGPGSCRVVAYVEREAYACEVLVSRMEKGDVDPAPVWTDVSTFDGRPFRGLVDVVSGGFPCQDISVAGKRAGITGARSGLWKQYLRIVSEVQPRLVFIENVAALRTSGLEVVLEDLASLGYDAEWGTLRASDVGATHHRDRVFILAHARRVGEHRVQPVSEPRRGCAARAREAGVILADASRDRRGQGRAEPDAEGGAEPRESGSVDVADCDGSRREGHGGSDRVRQEVPGASGNGFEWPLGPDDARWADLVAQRPDLEPSVRRVADGLAYRVDRLRLTGNGVVPAQAAFALRALLERLNG